MKFDKELFKAAFIRAAHTFLQSVVGMLTVGKAITDFDWKGIILVSLTTALISFIKSLLVGMPETTTEGTLMIDTTNPDKDFYLMNFDNELETLKTKKTVTFKVDPNANLNEGE